MEHRLVQCVTARVRSRGISTNSIVTAARYHRDAEPARATAQSGGQYGPGRTLNGIHTITGSINTRGVRYWPESQEGEEKWENQENKPLCGE